MGKNRNQNKNKNRAKRAKGAGGDDGETSKTQAASSNVNQTRGGNTKTVADEQKEIKELEETRASDAQDAVIPKAPAGTLKAKCDSVISNASGGPADEIKVAAQVAGRPRWNLRIRRWLWRCWPCRLVRWTYRFLVALVRIDWNDQQRAADVVLAVGLGGSVVFGVYVVGDFLLRHWGELMAVFPLEWFQVRCGWLRSQVDQAVDCLGDIWRRLVGLLERGACSGIRAKMSVLQLHCQNVLRGHGPWLAAWSAYPDAEDGI